ncbi:MAG: hypothetical protein HS116_05925 [Planctomycetes bacterium]|nr:hypothetical protein [Planctomycetota bacterium]
MPDRPETIGDTNALLRREMIDRIVGSLQIVADTEVRCAATDLSPQTEQRILRVGPEVFATELVERLFRPGWKPEPCGLATIPKSKGGHRILTPPRDQDRLWSWALYDILYARIEPYLHPNSFGFVRGRSNNDAVRALEDAIREQPYGVLMLADVCRCFASLPVDGLLRCLRPVVNDPMAMLWIEAAFRSRPRHPRIREVRRELVRSGKATPADLAYLDALHQTRRGIPEGSALSAVACVLYLRPLVDSLVAALPGATVVHYGDNLALWLRPGQERIAESVLQSESKSLIVQTVIETVLVPPCHRSARFLGIEFEWSQHEIRLIAPDKAIAWIIETVKSRKSKPEWNVVKWFVKWVWPKLYYYRDTDIGLIRRTLWDATEEWAAIDRYAVRGHLATRWLETDARWDRYLSREVLEADKFDWIRHSPIGPESWHETVAEDRTRKSAEYEEMMDRLYVLCMSCTAQGPLAQSDPGLGGSDRGGLDALLGQASSSLPLATPAPSA